MSTSKSPKRPMTADELTAIGMLRGVKFAVASWDKRAARHLFAVVEPPRPGECNCGFSLKEPELIPAQIRLQTHSANCPAFESTNWQPMISEKMAPQLWRVLFRYRRQIKHPERVKYLRMAEKLMVPDYRTPSYRKAQEEKYRIDAMRREAAKQQTMEAV